MSRPKISEEVENGGRPLLLPLLLRHYVFGVWLKQKLETKSVGSGLSNQGGVGFCQP